MNNRRMPWLAAAATLTFGACGGEDAEGEDAVVDASQALARSLCEKAGECGALGAGWDDVEGCEDAYRAYYESVFQEGMAQLPEASRPPCGEALRTVAGCYAESFSRETCEEFARDEMDTYDCVEEALSFHGACGESFW